MNSYNEFEINSNIKNENNELISSDTKRKFETMKKTDLLTTLFSHNLWANQRMLEECAKLSEEQLDATLEGTYGTIRDTLEHIVKAEQGYFSRVSAGERYQRPENEPQMTIQEMKDALEKTGKGFIEWAGKVGAEDTVEIDWDGVMRDVPKTTLLTQVINHATEHRSQIMTIMTQMGVEPPELDSWIYFDVMDKK
jgi:uncharacterized damage-inducible protein DinB